MTATNEQAGPDGTEPRTEKDSPSGDDAGSGDDPGGPADRPPAIETEDLRLTYDDGTEAVAGLSLSVPSGEFFGFLGPNGAGKTTTIRVLATLLSPTGGTVRVNGYDATDRPAAVRGTIGYMAQETSVDPELTARENLQFACAAYGLDRGERAGRIDELLDLVDLADVADKPAGEFSGGMAKRLDAATALVHEPPLVFLDEPTTGLDPKARNRLWDYFERINDRGTTVFLTTQYLEEADALCDRLAVIRDGSIVADGSPGELKRRVGGDVLEVTLDGGPDAADAAARVAREGGFFEPGATLEATGDGLRIATRRAREAGPDLLVALREAGVDVTGFDVEEATLDDVFLAIADERAGLEADPPGDSPSGGGGVDDDADPVAPGVAE